MVARHFSGGYAVEMTRVASARLKRTRDAADDISAVPNGTEITCRTTRR